ncbi:MAG: hypothetical protein HGA90_06800 [Alphaproteobacteria bacterium]|nr:hypothetical protein [Alphaproteobacteria bacterium]
MMSKLRVFFVQTPVQHDGRTGIVQPVEPVCHTFVRQHFPVNLGEISIGDDHRSPDHTSVLQDKANSLFFLCFDFSTPSVVKKRWPIIL